MSRKILPGPQRIAVLMGGISPERSVSLNSGRAVTRALHLRGHAVFPIVVNDTSLKVLSRLSVDAVFLALHGCFGEDGGVQTLLQERGLPYTGSGVAASARCFDKAAAKDALHEAGLPTPPARLLPRGLPESAVLPQLRQIFPDLGQRPLVVKPNRGGSSIGVRLVRSTDEAIAAVRETFARGDDALVETYIPGHEVTVALLDGQPLPVIALETARPFFDYVAKYEDGGTRYLIDRHGDHPQHPRAAALARAAYEVLGCRHLGRADAIIDEHGDVWLLEMNTLPGLTATSLLPKAAAAVGIDFASLCEILVALALELPVPSKLVEVG